MIQKQMFLYKLKIQSFFFFCLIDPFFFFRQLIPLSLNKAYLKNNKIPKLSGIPENNELVELDMSYNSLSFISDDFQYLTKLKKLDLSHNVLTSIPLTISENRTLQSLVLSFNKLEILPSLEALTMLEILEIDHNELPQLSDISSSLITLNVSHNSLKGSLKIGRFPKLESLDVSHNNLQEIDVGLLTNVRELNLSHNNFKLCPSLKLLVKLETLDLSENSIEALDELHLLETLQTCNLHSTKIKTLPTSLPLSLNQLTIFGVTADRARNLVQIIQAAETPETIIPKLIDLTSRFSHPLLLFPLVYYSAISTYRTVLLSNKILDVLYKSFDADYEKIQSDASRALTNLVEESNIIIFSLKFPLVYLVFLKQFIFKEECIELMDYEKVKHMCDEIPKRREEVRHSILSFFIALIINGGRESFQSAVALQDLEHLCLSETVQKVREKFYTLLNLLGDHTFLHFGIEPRETGLRILTFDGGGSKAIVTLEMLKIIEGTSSFTFYIL